MQSIEKKIDLIDKYYKNLQETSIVFIYGEKGLGKSFAIREFLYRYDDLKILHITSNSSDDFYLAPIEHAIFKIQSLIEDEANLGLNYSEKTMRRLIQFCIDNKCILYFENLHMFDKKLLMFSKSLVNNLLINYPQLKTYIIIEFDTNDENENLDFIQTFYDLFPAEFINFERIDNFELELHIQNFFGNVLSIESRDMEYIIDSSFGNIKLCNIILNYLRQKGIINKDKENWKCKSIKSGTLSNVLKNSIQERYSKLDDNLKSVLKKSSLLGFEFESSTLSNTFCILKAEEKLKKIEELSSLISKKELHNDYFSFENQEIFLFTQNQMPQDEKNILYHILEEYFIKLYKNSITLKEINHYYLAANYIFKAASYSMAYGNYINSYQYYKIALAGFINSMDYEKSLITISKVEELSKIIDIDRYILFKIQYWKAECYEYTGIYSEAKEQYIKCKNEYKDLINNYQKLKYHIAYCTYYSSEVFDSLNQLIDLTNEKLIPSILCNVSSLLSTIYQEIGDYSKSKIYYNNAIKICQNNNLLYEYHVQLRKAQVCNDFSDCIYDIKKSILYFDNGEYIKELAKAEHNLGLNYLVLGNYIKALPHFYKSIELFNSFSSIDVLYSYVCLGIYQAVYKNDYDSAINYFKKSFYDEMNAYKKLCVYSNLVICYTQIKEYEEANRIIEIMENMEARKLNKDIPYYHKTLYFAQAYFYTKTGNTDKAFDIYESCLDKNLTKGQSFFVNSKIMQLNNELKELSEIIETDDKLYYDFLKIDSCFTFLKFVE